jgi:hypothetical protein
MKRIVLLFLCIYFSTANAQFHHVELRCSEGISYPPHAPHAIAFDGDVVISFFQGFKISAELRNEGMRTDYTFHGGYRDSYLGKKANHCFASNDSKSRKVVTLLESQLPVELGSSSVIRVFEGVENCDDLSVLIKYKRKPTISMKCEYLLLSN